MNIEKAEAAFNKAQRERDDAMHCYETILELLDEPQRVCDECGAGMDEGYCIDSGCEYYCSDACLHKHYTPKEWEAIYRDGDGDSYYTEWETADYEELDDAEAALEKAEQALTAARIELGRARLSEGG